jgi:hypothetical protein
MSTVQSRGKREDIIACRSQLHTAALPITNHIKKMGGRISPKKTTLRHCSLFYLFLIPITVLLTLVGRAYGSCARYAGSLPPFQKKFKKKTRDPVLLKKNMPPRMGSNCKPFARERAIVPLIYAPIHTNRKYLVTIETN